MTHTSTDDTEAMHLVSKRRKDMAAWAVENFKTWPKPHEITDADPEEIGCELVVLNQHHLPVLRCKLGGGYVDSTTWFYAKRNPKKMTQAQQPEALRLADKYEIEGFLQDHRFAKDHWCRQAAAELRRLHARIEELEDATDIAIERIAELEAQIAAIGAGGVEPMRKQAVRRAPAEPVISEAQVLAITTAYEQGVGKGHQSHARKEAITNPYGDEWGCDSAWQMGYDEGREQAERSSAEGAAAQSSKDRGKKDATDWKEIALALAQRVNFAVTNLSCKSGGMLNLETFDIQSWREYMAEGLEMIPGIVVDREILATLELSPAQRKKAQAEITTKRAAQARNKKGIEQ